MNSRYRGHLIGFLGNKYLPKNPFTFNLYRHRLIYTGLVFNVITIYFILK